MFPVAIRRLARLLVLFLVLAGGLAAGARATGLQVELLADDLPASAVVEAARGGSQPPLWQARGERIQRVLPYRDEGSWLRIVTEALPPEALLVIEGQLADTVQLHLPGGRVITRSKMSPNEAGASPLALVFPLPADLPSGSVLLLHAAHHHRVNVDFSVVPAAQWRDYERTRLIVSAALYTAMAAFALFAACYWVALRETMFADYTGYLALLTIFMTSSSGLLYALPGGEWFGRLGIHGQWAAAWGAIGCAVGFSRGFLDLARHAPRAFRMLRRVRFAMLASAAVIAVWPWPAAGFGMLLVAVLQVVNLWLIVLGVMTARAGNRYGWYFLAGWVPLNIATSLRGLQAAGLVETPASSVYLYALGAVWEALVLTLGIADRVLSFRRERDQARKLAEHDGLTGVLNRRAVELQLRAMTSEARAGGNGVGVLFVDVDHFKSINDNFGHAAGDACLVAVAQRLQAELRESDQLGRWGGEEFVVLLPGASLENAHHTSDRILRRVATEPVQVQDAGVSMTVSIGIAVFDPLHDEAETVLQRADAALYRAKANGRNRVERAACAG
jgi:diguanylate cyclase (GGDEF)-like protein